MAIRSLRFCHHPGCNRLVSTTYCEEHAVLHQPKDNRAPAYKRGYDYRWRKLRDAYLAAHPLCAICEAEGRTTTADTVDHIIPIEEGGARLDPRNLRSLCRSCHEIRHGRKIKREDEGRGV